MGEGMEEGIRGVGHVHISFIFLASRIMVTSGLKGSDILEMRWVHSLHTIILSPAETVNMDIGKPAYCVCVCVCVCVQSCN